MDGIAARSSSVNGLWKVREAPPTFKNTPTVLSCGGIEGRSSRLPSNTAWNPEPRLSNHHASPPANELTPAGEMGRG